MYIKEYADDILDANVNMSLNTRFEDDNSTIPYKISGLINLRGYVLKLMKIPLFTDAIKSIHVNSPLFRTNEDATWFTESEYHAIVEPIKEIKAALKYLSALIADNYSQVDEFTIDIKLPSIHTFEDMSKICNDFKRALDIPIAELHDESKVEIFSAEKGSIWFIVSLGTNIAVRLVARICSLAIDLKSKYAEARAAEEYTRGLKLKNDYTEMFINAQKEMLETYLSVEVKEIASKYYPNNDEQIEGKLKLAINTTVELFDKGAKIIQTGNNETKKLFPDYDTPDLLDTPNKQIKNEN